MLELELALIETLPARFLTAAEIILMVEKHVEATNWLLEMHSHKPTQ